jgi:hypothetical protein
MRKEKDMPVLVAQRLWAAARLRGGSIALNDVSESDIAHGRAEGWLTRPGLGCFQATEKLRQAAISTTGYDGEDVFILRK